MGGYARRTFLAGRRGAWQALYRHVVALTLQIPAGTLSVSVHEGTNVEELKLRMAALVADRYGVQLPPEPFGNEFVRDR